MLGLSAILSVGIARVAIDTGHKQHSSSATCSLSNADGLCDNSKVSSLETSRERKSKDDVMTSNQGIPIVDDDNSLKAGERGLTLLEDFFFVSQKNNSSIDLSK